jgi:hypothetical protein
MFVYFSAAGMIATVSASQTSLWMTTGVTREENSFNLLICLPMVRCH